MSTELVTDSLLDEIAIAPTESITADSAIVGMGDVDSDAADLDPFGDALPVGTQPTLMEAPYTTS